MLTINADEHQFMKQFHKPCDEKRSVVVLPDDSWADWLDCGTTDEARFFLSPFAPDLMAATPDPIVRKKPNVV